MKIQTTSRNKQGYRENWDFGQKKDFLLSVSQNQEIYAVSKFYTCNLLKAMWRKKHSRFYMTLIVRVNYWYTLWNVGSAVSNTLGNQKQNLTLD